MESPLESLLTSLMPHWPGVVFHQRPDLSLVVVGGQLEELTGHPAARWQQEPGLFWSLLHELDGEEYRRRLIRLEQGTVAELTHSFRIRQGGSGRVRHITEFRQAARDAAGKLSGFHGYWLDATRQTLAERRLAGAVWKETVGVLTLGLTHDFNNMMAGILGLTEAWLGQIPNDHPFAEGLGLMKRNAERAAALIRRMDHLHRATTGVRSYHDLNEVVRDTLDLLRKALPRRIEVVQKLAPQQLPLYADAVELRQVLLNLALNAADAMPERGTCTIETCVAGDLASFEHGVGRLPPAPAVGVAVTDTGGGIRRRFLPMLFDPFFTTKPMNRGSGLGLYNARLFVEKHQGALTVVSKEGAGSTFQIWLPQADFTEQERALQALRQQRRSLLVYGPPGRLRDETADILRQQNYHVVSSAADAEDLLRSGDYVFDGLMLLVELGDRVPLALSGLVRRLQLPLRVIVKPVGCNPDELPSELLSRANMVISADLPGETVIEQLAELLSTPH